MRKFVLASLFVGLILFIITVQQAGTDSVSKTISFFPALVIFVTFFIIFFAVGIVSAWRWKVIIESQNSHKIGFSKVLGARLAAFAISYVTPAVLVGGDPVRAYMIKEESDYSLEKSFASVIIDEAIYFFTLFLFMIIGFLFLIDHFALPKSIFFSFLIFILAGVFVLYLFYTRMVGEYYSKEGFFIFIIKLFRLDKIKYIGDRLNRVVKTEKIIAEFFKNKKDIFVKAFFLSILEVMLYMLMIWIIVSYLGAAINFVQSLSIFSTLTLASFIPIPGSFGSLELSLTFIFNLLGFSKGDGFAFSLIFRLVNIMLVVSGFLALIYFELKTISYDSAFESAPKILLDMHKFIVKLFYKK